LWGYRAVNQPASHSAKTEFSSHLWRENSVFAESDFLTFWFTEYIGFRINFSSPRKRVEEKIFSPGLDPGVAE
jgi:hypothetical protein